MRIALAITSVLLLGLSAVARADSLARKLSERSDLIDISTLTEEVQVELKYSSTDNFMGADVYGDLDACYLNRDAARMLARAASLLSRRHPDLRLRVYDCVRPLAIQRSMWKLVEGTPQQPYVGNPNARTKSLHNYACAVDLTLATADGVPLDMGSPYDHFGPEAEPRAEKKLLAKGVLSAEQVERRRLLRRVMKKAGFRPLRIEWWHFACARGTEARKRYRLVE